MASPAETETDLLRQRVAAMNALGRCVCFVICITVQVAWQRGVQQLTQLRYMGIRHCVGSHTEMGRVACLLFESAEMVEL
jgi:hypothetical protein